MYDPNLTLLFLQEVLDFTNTHRVVLALQRGIEEACERIDEVADDPQASLVVDDEAHVVEDIVGAQFLVMQRAITSVVNSVCQLHDEEPRLRTTDGTKLSIMQYGGTVVDGGVKAIEAINAAANYFKHRDDWRGPWKDLPSREARTASVLMRVGCREGTTGNFRIVAEALGNHDYEQPQVALGELDGWAKALHAAYSEELRRIAD